MMHPGLAALKHWDREEYAAGYRARFSDIPDFETSHPCWRCGWEDADTEVLESARHRPLRKHLGQSLRLGGRGESQRYPVRRRTDGALEKGLDCS
jgi:hypothetical protein